jgi:hypothetical protein
MTGTFQFQGRTLARVETGSCTECPFRHAPASTCVDVNDAAKAVGIPHCWSGSGGQQARFGLTEQPALLTEDPDHGDPAVPDALAYKPSHGGYPEGERMPLASDSHARAADPQTSHDAAAKVGGGKLVDLILVALTNNPQGLVGKDIAIAVGRPLNSITPRFAPMRRAGYIHAAGKSEKQIVWKIGNGVAA